ncbi:MAG: S8 family serine peptidase [Clostridia bacterium]|nr:S8 family serine peptidase [Clostridia bacterium]
MKFKAKFLVAFLLTVVILALKLSADDGTYIVKFVDGYTPDTAQYALEEVYADKGLYLTDDPEMLEPIKAYIERISPNSEVELIEGDMGFSTLSLPEDPYYSSLQVQLKMINASAAWELESYGNDIKVAVIDSGCHAHDELVDNLLEGKNYIDGTTDVSDNQGHGTHVSGIIAAQMDNVGVVGVAPKAKIVPLKCFETGKSTNVDALLQAIYEAVDVYGCKIINMSWGAAVNIPDLQEAIEYAAGKGVILIASVGNDNSVDLRYPAAYDCVVGVGSVDSSKVHSSFSQYNTSVTVVAPGEDVPSTYKTGGYANMSGTSQAAPMVSGMAALALSMDEDMTSAEFRELLTNSTEDLGDEGYDVKYGYGLVDMSAFIAELFEDIPHYVSPINMQDNEAYVLVKNNTESDFSAVSIFSEYSGKRFSGRSQTSVALASGETTIIKLENSENSNIAHFLWGSADHIRPLANKRDIINPSTATILCVSAYAAETVDGGFYNIGEASNVTVVTGAEEGSVTEKNLDVDGDGTDDLLYSNSDQLTVTYSAATNGAYYGLILVEGSDVPTVNDTVYYIDQQTAASGTVTFNVLPLLPYEATEMTLYISSSVSEEALISIPLGYTTDITSAPSVGDESGTVNPVIYVAKVGDTSYATLAEALAADGDVTLLANITDEVTVSKEVAIIKNGFTANVVAGAGYEVIETDDAYNVYTAVTPFELSGVTMTLGSSLSLDFAVNTANFTGTDNYAKMTIVYADGGESYTVTVPQSEWTQFSGTIYTAKFTGMAAKQMNDVVTVVFYNAKGQALTIAKSDSIETYSIRMLNGNAASNKKLRTVYVDMLNYGAAAQVQFDYDETNLANRNLTEAHQAWATASVATTDNRVKGTGYAGSTLTLSGEIQLDLVFKNSAVGSDYSSLYALATYTDHYGNAKEIRIEGTDFIKYSSTMCQISITGMAVADFRSVVSCTVYNADGEAVANASDSVESYANRNSASLGAVVDTIVKFGESSYNFFH